MTNTNQPAPTDFLPDADNDTRQAAWQDRINRLNGWTPYTVNQPVRYQGPDAEANRATHLFDYGDPDARCYDCDARPSHAAASYPCGASVPREVRTFWRNPHTV